MSAFPQSGRSDAWNQWFLSGCFRPEAAIQQGKKISAEARLSINAIMRKPQTPLGRPESHDRCVDPY